ncbi:MAG: TetR family transcriptional regulator [Actinomycetota bacterium]|nr:TetR family transcriptional regulator [Actinomycetota bacterium]
MAPISDALRRREGRDAEPSFERLLRAARELFATDGFAATPLDAVCAEAGVTKGSLYHHFGGKAELFEAVFEREAATLSAEVAEAALRRRDPWQVARAGIRGFLDASQDPGVQRIMLLDGLSVLGWERVREIEAEYGLALIKTVIATLMDAGEIRRHDVDVLSHLLFGALVEGALLMARSDDAAAARRRVEREVRAVIEGLRT